jgi:hypothetical protein
MLELLDAQDRFESAFLEQDKNVKEAGRAGLLFCSDRQPSEEAE